MLIRWGVRDAARPLALRFYHTARPINVPFKGFRVRADNPRGITDGWGRGLPRPRARELGRDAAADT